MHICTTCDHKYIHKGLALYKSLTTVFAVNGQQDSSNFTLHWLCFDDIIYEKLNQLSLPNVILYSLPALEDMHPELRAAKNNPKSNYGDEYSQYCWTLTPWFIHYLLCVQQMTDIDKLLYADSDIFFYHTPKTIAEIVGDKGVGIHTHRFTPPYKEDIDTGWYNVGVMLFNNTPVGKSIAWFWKNLVLDVNNHFYKSHGTCGDQKYLELFMPLFGEENVCVFDQEEYEYNMSSPPPVYKIVHKAPWCPNGANSILFYHFSHFNHDFAADTWRDHNNIEKPEWTPSTYPGLWQLYQDYYNVIKDAEELLQSAANEQRTTTNAQPAPDFRIDIIGNIKVDESKPERIKMLIASIRSLAFLKDHCKFMLLMEGASPTLQQRVRKELTECGFNFILCHVGSPAYGKNCSVMLKACTAPYVLNFLEDHFCMMDSVHDVADILKTMRKNRVDALKTSFHHVEMKSIETVRMSYADESGNVFHNDTYNHQAYQKHWQRYYISVHFLATREFAQRFWDRDLGPRPHEYEMLDCNGAWMHIAMVPMKELLCSIDDDHGEPGTSLLVRPHAKKFWDIYNTL